MRRVLRWLERGVIAVFDRLPVRLRLTLRRTAPVLCPLDYRIPLVLHTDSLLEYGTRTQSCAKEPETVAWIEALPRGAVLYDIGANVGAYALVAAAVHREQVRVLAFEPAFMNYSQLCRNIVVNDLAETIAAFPVALSDRTGWIPFHYLSVEPGMALHASGTAVNQQGRAFAPTLSVPTLTFRLDDLIAICHLPAPTHLKIDVDGAEWRVLQGAEKALTGVVSLLVEVDHGHPDHQAFLAWLLARGFQLEGRYRSPLNQGPGPASDAHNYVFSRG